MDKWKSAITAGNQAFDQNNDSLAEEHYDLACSLSEQMVFDNLETQESTLALVVSYQNLADLYFRQQRYAEALYAYRKLNRCLLGLYNNRLVTHKIQAIIDHARRKIGTELMCLIESVRDKLPEADTVLQEITMDPQVLFANNYQH